LGGEILQAQGEGMIEPKLNEPRIEYLARVLYAFMQENGTAAECTVDYDGTTCDGQCLANDFLSELGTFEDDV
jgi:hypothetical protein